MINKNFNTLPVAFWLIELVVVVDCEVDGPSTLGLALGPTLIWTVTSLTFDVTVTGSWSGMPKVKKTL